MSNHTKTIQARLDLLAVQTELSLSASMDKQITKERMIELSEMVENSADVLQRTISNAIEILENGI